MVEERQTVMIKLDLTEQEAQALVQFLDAGLKAVGLSGAEPAAVLNRKIGEAFRAAQVVPAEAANDNAE